MLQPIAQETVYTDWESDVCYRKLGDIDRSKANLLVITGLDSIMLQPSVVKW